MWQACAIIILALALSFYPLVGLSLHGRLGGLELAQVLVNWSLVLLLLCSRVFLIVECFISFRSAPMGMYENTRWLSYWPHIH